MTIVLCMLGGRVLEIAVRVLLARHWGPETFGLITLGITILSAIAVICFLGMQTTLTRYVAFYLAKNEHSTIKGVLLTGLGIPLFLSLAGAVLMFATANLIASFFHEPALVPILKAFALSLPFFVFFRISLAAIRGFGRMFSFGFNSYISRQLCTLTGLGLILVLGLKSVIPVQWVFAASWFVVALFSFLVLQNTSKKYLKTTKSKLLVVELLAFTWPLILAHYVHEIRTWADLFFIEYFYDAAEVGKFQAMATLARLLNLILVGFSFAGLPILTKLVSSDHYSELRRLYETVSNWMLYFACPALAYLIFFGNEAIGLFFGSSFKENTLALSFLAFGFFFHVTAGMIGPVYNAMKWNKRLLVIDIFGIIANLTLNFVLVPLYGIIGAAAATSMSLIFTTTLSLVMLYRGIGIVPTLLKRPFYPALMLAIGALCKLIVMSVPEFNDSLVAIISFIVLVVVSLTIVLNFFGLSPEEKDIIRSLKKRVIPDRNK